MERRILQVGQILPLVQQRPVMVDAGGSIGQNGRGGVGIVMEFSLIPGTLQRQDEALVARRGVLLGERKQGDSNSKNKKQIVEVRIMTVSIPTG
jgi:hypothetical protein